MADQIRVEFDDNHDLHLKFGDHEEVYADAIYHLEIDDEFKDILAGFVQRLINRRDGSDVAEPSAEAKTDAGYLAHDIILSLEFGTHILQTVIDEAIQKLLKEDFPTLQTEG